MLREFFLLFRHLSMELLLLAQHVADNVAKVATAQQRHYYYYYNCSQATYAGLCTAAHSAPVVNIAALSSSVQSHKDRFIKMVVSIVKLVILLTVCRCADNF